MLSILDKTFKLFNVTITRLTISLIILLAILYSGWLTYVTVYDRPLDFYVYYMAGEAVSRGQNPYTISGEAWNNLAADLDITNYTTPYRYPPHTAALLALFRPIGPGNTMILWVIANALAMIGGAWLIGGAWGGWWLPLSLGTLLIFVPPLATLLSGQINGLLFFALAVAVWAIIQQRPGWLGIGLAIGTTLKVIPLALLLYLFWRRQWRAALIGVAVLVGLTIGSAFVVGREGLRSYIEQAILLSAPDVIHSTGSNQTISGVLGRFMPTAPTLVLGAGRWLGGLVILTTALLCWPAGKPSDWMPLEFGLIVAALQLIPPFTWYHQLVLLLIPLLIVVKHLWRGEHKKYLFDSSGRSLTAPDVARSGDRPQHKWRVEQKKFWYFVLILLFLLTDIHGFFWHQLSSPWLLAFPFLLGLALWLLLGGIILGEKFKFWQTTDQIEQGDVSYP